MQSSYTLPGPLLFCLMFNVTNYRLLKKAQKGQLARFWSTYLVSGAMHLVKGTDGSGGPGL